jgi:hypothetical protein
MNRAALALSILAVVLSTTGWAQAAKKALLGSATPHPNALLRLGKNAKFPASAIPTVKNAQKVGGKSAGDLVGSCQPTSVDLGTWCLMAAPYPLADNEVGKNDYFFATQKCVSLGGYLPSAAQLIGAANSVKLSSVIGDAQLTANIDLDPTDGLSDQREMSGTLVTTAAGSSAAGSEGVSDGATGNPKTGQPNPTPLPANPAPDTLQYVTVYDNANKGGFAGSQPVTQPQTFRCAFNKIEGAGNESNQ